MNTTSKIRRPPLKQEDPQKKLLASLAMIVLGAIAFSWMLSKIFVGNKNKTKVSVTSTLDSQKKIETFLYSLAKNRTAFERTLESNDSLRVCANECKRGNDQCAQQRTLCTHQPADSSSESIRQLPTLDLRDADNRLVAAKDGSVFINDKLQPCAKVPPLNGVEADASCQWRIEFRAFANEQATIVFHFALVNESPITKLPIRLSDLEFKIDTGLPKLFYFKRFSVKGRVDASRALNINFMTDGDQMVEALIQCTAADKSEAVINPYVQDCKDYKLSNTSFMANGGRAAAQLNSLSFQTCNLNVSVDRESANCTIEVSSQAGRFSRAHVNTVLGTARLDNLSLVVFDPTRAETGTCVFQNGGLLGPVGPGLVSGEMNLCNCAKYACFEKEGTIRIQDQDPFQMRKEVKVTPEGELWIEIRNGESTPAAVSVGVTRDDPK